MLVVGRKMDADVNISDLDFCVVHPHGYEPNQSHVTSSGATIHRKKKL